MHRKNKLLLPHAIVSEPNFTFFSRGKDMFSESLDFREELEDSFRHQLEWSDRLQGFHLAADVTSGCASLTKIIIDEFVRDEAPKAPVLLYASEYSNPFVEKLK